MAQCAGLYNSTVGKAYIVLEEEVYDGTVWTCKICRTLPDMLNYMQKDLAEVAKTNANLISDFKDKVKQNNILRKENE